MTDPTTMQMADHALYESLYAIYQEVRGNGPRERIDKVIARLNPEDLFGPAPWQASSASFDASDICSRRKSLGLPSPLPPGGL